MATKTAKVAGVVIGVGLAGLGYHERAKIGGYFQDMHRQLLQDRKDIATATNLKPDAKPEVLAALAKSENDVVLQAVSIYPNTPQSVQWDLYNSCHRDDAFEMVHCSFTILRNLAARQDASPKLLDTIARSEWLHSDYAPSIRKVIVEIAKNKNTTPETLDFMVRYSPYRVDYNDMLLAIASRADAKTETLNYIITNGNDDVKKMAQSTLDLQLRK